MPRRHLLFVLLLLVLGALFSLYTAPVAPPVSVPPLQPAPPAGDTYPVLTTTITPGAAEDAPTVHSFRLQATAARLALTNQGLQGLEIDLNGRRLDLSAHLDAGETVYLDIDAWVHYGGNTLTAVPRGPPGSSADLVVAAPVLTLHLLGMNDIHGVIDPLPRAAAYINAVRARGGVTFFVHAGDLFSGDPVSDLNQGRPVIEALNAMRLDLNAVGNHDFDHGPVATASRRAESDFVWLSANTAVTDPAATPIEPFQPYLLHTTDLGQRIAFIGLTQTPPATVAENIAGLSFSDPVETARRYIDALQDEVNLIVLVSHNGNDWAAAAAPRLTGAHVIIEGHSHTYQAEPLWVGGIAIMQAGAHSRRISHLVLRQAETVTVAPGAPDGRYFVETAALTELDEDTRAVVAAWNRRMAPVLDVTVGCTAQVMQRHLRYRMDVALGNLLADAMLAHTGADIALVNNGGIRADLPAQDTTAAGVCPGLIPITMRDIYTLLPFGNRVMTFDLTGAQVRRIIEHSYTREGRNQLDLQTAGLSYFIFTQPGSDELQQVSLRVGNEPLQPDRRYRVAVTDYLAGGGGGYPLPTMADPVWVSAATDAEILRRFIVLQGVLDYPFTEGRAGSAALPTPGPVRALNFHSTSSLLAAAGDGSLELLTDQATVLVHAEATAYQRYNSRQAPKNFFGIAYPAGTPIPLAALEQVGQGQVAALGAHLIGDGYRPQYDNAAWFTGLIELLAGDGVRLLFDDGHGQYRNAANLRRITAYLEGRGHSVRFTGPAAPLSTEALAAADVVIIPTPGDGAGLYTQAELAALARYVAAGGRVVLLSQSDYGNYSNPAELNAIAAALGAVLRFNSDQVEDQTHHGAGGPFSPVTGRLHPALAELQRSGP